MEPHVLQAALAGLLHDIGKFSHRAGEGIPTDLNQEQNLRGLKYRHALHTLHFAKTYLPETWQKANVGTLAAYHHLPQGDAGWIIRIADQLSGGEGPSGQERDDSDRQSHPKQLRSIFCAVVTDDTEKAPRPLYLPLNQLSLEKKVDEKVIFPGEPEKDDKKIWKSYEDLWRDFCLEAKALKAVHDKRGDLPTYLESLLLLLQRYVWCIPSAYFNAEPDVSLYDHGRMTAALAATLSDTKFQTKEWSALKTNPLETETEVAVLVGGDISGVQDFIYTISHRGASSMLRGRSFYLQMLTEAVARYTLHLLELPITNLIYAGGGGFYLLARRGDEGRLQEIRLEVSRILWAHHRGDLYLALAEVPLQGVHFKLGGLSQRWQALAEELQRAKHRRFSELPTAELSHVFVPQGTGGDEEKQCNVCGREHPGTEKYRREGVEDVRKCPPCKSYEDLGKDLRNAAYLVLTLSDPPSPPPILDRLPDPGGYEECLQAFGLAAKPMKDKPVIRQNERQIHLALKDKIVAELKPARLTAVGRRLLVNVTPQMTAQEAEDYFKVTGEKKDEGDVKPFDLLEKQSYGIKRLGVLRMDVDNLGSIFSKGLENASLSRLAALSFAVSLYFEGWVSELAKAINRQTDDQSQPRRDVLYAIYSGGDDLFFVGAWDAVVELAIAIRRELTPYAADHPGLHASAGIALVGGKYPLAQAAEDAGEAESRAKTLTWWQNGKPRPKDAVSFLGLPLPWRRFGLEDKCDPGLATAHALMHRLSDSSNDNKSNQPLIRRLISVGSDYLEAEDKRRKEGRDLAGKPGERPSPPQPLWGRWNWLGVYLLKRIEKPETRDDVQEMRREFFDLDKFKGLEWVALAARWAELWTRGE